MNNEIFTSGQSTEDDARVGSLVRNCVLVLVLVLHSSAEPQHRGKAGLDDIGCGAGCKSTQGCSALVGYHFLGSFSGLSHCPDT